MPPPVQAETQQLIAPFSLIPESDCWIPLGPSLLYGDWYGNSASVTAPLEIAMGTDSLIPEYDDWISLGPSLLHGDWYGNGVSVAAPLEIAMGTDFNMGVGFLPPVTRNVQPSSVESRPCIFEINPRDKVPKVLVDQDPDIEVCPIQSKDLLAEIGPGLNHWDYHCQYQIPYDP